MSRIKSMQFEAVRIRGKLKREALRESEKDKQEIKALKTELKEKGPKKNEIA